MSLRPTRVVSEPREFSTPVDGVSLTKQSFAKEADINHILAKYETTGIIPHGNPIPGFYGDVSSVPDYQDALRIVSEADSAFSALPAALRARFHNNAAAYLEFVSNPANRDEMIKLGLIEIPKDEKDMPPIPKPTRPKKGEKDDKQKSNSDDSLDNDFDL